MAIGLTSASHLEIDEPLWHMWDYINLQTPRDAHVLIASFYTTFGISSGGAFWIQRPAYTTDGHLQGFIKLTDWPSFLSSVERAGIDVVVISDTQFVANRYGFAFPAGANEYPFCRRLVTEFGTRVFEFDHLQVYRLRSLSLPAGR